MEQFLIDNNVISNFFAELYPKGGMDFIEKVINKQPIISVITQIEALSWINSDKTKELIVVSFIEEANILALTPAIVRQCIKLRRSRKIKTPDAIIAATALVHNLSLVSSDKDFKNIQNLNCINPYDL